MRPIHNGNGAQAILVIEDNALLQEAYREILKARGYRTVAAMTGEEGLRLAREERPDLILLDIMLPDLTGWEVKQRLDREPVPVAAPVVALSAIGDQYAPERALEEGFATFLRKPIRMAALIQVIEFLIGSAGSPDAALASNSE